MIKRPATKLQLSKGFPLDFALISKILQYSARHSGRRRVSYADLIGYLESNESKIENLCSLAAGLGLIRGITLVSTDLGLILASADPFFDDIGVLWLLHFIVGANQRHLVWNRIVNQVVPNNRIFDQEKIRSYFADLSPHFSEKSIRNHLYKEISVVLDSYTEQQFSRLQYIRAQNGKYVWSSREPVPALIALCCFLVYRDLYAPGASALDFNQLTSADNSFGRICMVNEDQVRRIADDLRANGLVYVESRADLDQIRFTDPFAVTDILQRYLEER